MNRLIGFIMAAAVLITGPALAQPQVVTVAATPERTKVTAGDRLAVAIVMEFKDGFHAWPAQEQDALPPEIKASGLEVFYTAVTAERAGPVSTIGSVQWPELHEEKVADPTGMQATINAQVFSGRAIAYLPIAIADDASSGSFTLDVTVSYQVCDDTSCLMPEDRTIPVTFEVVEDAAAAAASGTDAALFSGFDARILATLGDAPDGTVAATTTPGAAKAPAAAAAPATRPSLFGYEMPDFAGPVGLVMLLLISALGGAVLNLTPCVLPVIPIKILTLSQHAAEPGRRIALGLWMAVGVVAFWAAIGVPMAFISSTLDPSRLIFGNWYIVLGIGLVIAVMGIGIMGLFELRLPQAVYSVNPKADTAWGSFAFGVMTAVLGLPCFGFVAGGLLAGAAVLGATKIMVIFLGLGIGMAAPYLVLSAYPALVNRIPRTGPASELVKQVMGLLLLAAAAFFVTAGIKGLLNDMPHLEESIGWWIVAIFVAVAVGWMTLRIFQITKRVMPRLILPVLGLVSVVGLFAFANGMTRGAWLEFTPAMLQKARDSGKVVVVDFTADWCINCKALKATVLDREPVRTRLLADDVLLLEVDLTSTKAPGWEYLQQLGQTGVPTLAIYGPSMDKPIVYNAYTPDLVLNAIDRVASAESDSTTASSAAP